VTPSPTPNPNHVVLVGSGGNNFVDSISGNSLTTITAGETVEWQWVVDLHSTTSGTCDATNCIPDFLWSSGNQTPPFTFTRTFSVVGTFPYFCTVHGVSMQGLVNVLP
jgi:plastocyanin